MKLLLTIARILVGLLFIFSGLVKANDPLGLSYKMQEYFEVWQLHALYHLALPLALVMNVFEVVAGIALLIGWRMKLFSWLLLLLIVFFTFLTGYAAFSGRIAACGCFGDCIPLAPVQSFWKDVALLVLIIFILVFHRRIRPLLSNRVALLVITVSTALVSLFQWWVLEHLPVKDCLPYREGNNLLEQMKRPAGYIPDEYRYIFIYEKNGKKYEFTEENLPEDESYVFKDRKEKLVRKGNNLEAKITDFNLVTESGTDSTNAILESGGAYVLVFAQSIDSARQGRYNPALWQEIARVMPVYIVTADPEGARRLWGSRFTVLKADGTVIKTAARANPTYFLMQGATVKEKFSYADEKSLRAALIPVKKG